MVAQVTLLAIDHLGILEVNDNAILALAIDDEVRNRVGARVVVLRKLYGANRRNDGIVGSDSLHRAAVGDGEGRSVERRFLRGIRTVERVVDAGTLLGRDRHLGAFVEVGAVVRTADLRSIERSDDLTALDNLALKAVVGDVVVPNRGVVAAIVDDTIVSTVGEEELHKRIVAIERRDVIVPSSGIRHLEQVARIVGNLRQVDGQRTGIGGGTRRDGQVVGVGHVGKVGRGQKARVGSVAARSRCIVDLELHRTRDGSADGQRQRRVEDVNSAVVLAEDVATILAIDDECVVERERDLIEAALERSKLLDRHRRVGIHLVEHLGGNRRDNRLVGCDSLHRSRLAERERLSIDRRGGRRISTVERVVDRSDIVGSDRHRRIVGEGLRTINKRRIERGDVALARDDGRIDVTIIRDFFVPKSSIVVLVGYHVEVRRIGEIDGSPTCAFIEVPGRAVAPNLLVLDIDEVARIILHLTKRASDGIHVASLARCGQVGIRGHTLDIRSREDA